MRDLGEMSIRRVRVGDGSELYGVFLASIHGLAAASYTPQQLGAWTSQITPARLEARLTQTVSFAVERSGGIIAFGSLDANHAELDFLYVHPDYARQGVGRRLSSRLEEEALRRGIGRLELTASLNAVPAYERLGYRRVRDMAKTIGSVTVPCIRMEKSLVDSG